MSDKPRPALTAEQWENRDYRQTAKDLDRWAGGAGSGGDDEDRTEYVAKLGLDDRGSVIVMNRAHDKVLIPPPARPALAAFALYEQPSGFAFSDVAALRRAVELIRDRDLALALGRLSDRVEALLPPSEA